MSNSTEAEKSGFDDLLNGDTLASVKLKYLVKAWRSEQLCLPAIQRSLVWDNKRIIDYWDTLLRGWFPGLMLVHEPKPSENPEKPYLELFDGQQRLATILLGLGEGPFAANRRLWIEVGGASDEAGPGRKFALRITSRGQPFGYRRENPNEKLPLEARRRAFDAWVGLSEEMTGTKTLRPGGNDDVEDEYKIIANEYKIIAKKIREFVPDARLQLNYTDPEGQIREMRGRLHKIAFEHVTGADLPRATGGSEGRRVVELKEWMCPLFAEDKPEPESPLDSIAEACRHVPKLQVAVRKLDDALVKDEGYQEFFRRIGQGGVPLNEDELAYSLIKFRFPKVREVLEGMASCSAIGLLASPTQIALAAFRVVRLEVLSAPERAKFSEWEMYGRPEPKFIADLPESNLPNGDDVRRNAMNVIVSKFESLFANDDYGIELRMTKVREILAGIGESKAQDGTGFPTILLGRLPPELIDIVLMLAPTSIDAPSIRAFCLWVLIFGNARDAAFHLAKAKFETTQNPVTCELLRDVIKLLESRNKADVVPTAEEFSQIFLNLPCRATLMKFEERFKASNKERQNAIANLFGKMHFRKDIGKNLLLFLQRKYINEYFGEFDPTSGWDDDLPVDLDHIVPAAHFGFNWSDNNIPSFLKDESRRQQQESFRKFRHEIGNLIGNLRFLSASENRRRGAGFGNLMGCADLTANLLPGRQDKYPILREDNLKKEFEILIEKNLAEGGASNWDQDDVSKWQHIVLMRTASLVERLIDEGGIRKILDGHSPVEPQPQDNAP